MRILTIIAAVIGLPLLAPVHAQFPNQPSGSHAPGAALYSAQDPRKVVQAGIDKIRTFVESKQLNDPADLQRFVETEVAPFFDFSVMSSLVLGHLQYSLDRQQRDEVSGMIKQRFLAALADNLFAYKGGRTQLMNINGNLYQGRVNVILRVYRRDQYPTVVELRIARIQGEWKIYDVAANGVSAITHYRNYVHSLVQRSGIQALFTHGMGDRSIDPD